MNLENILRIRLFTFFHTCEGLVDLLDDLDKAISGSSGSIRNLYDLSHRCIDKAFQEFCYVQPIPTSYGEACQILLVKFDACLAIAYSQSYAVKKAFIKYRTKIEKEPVPSDNPFDFYIRIGNALAKEVLESYQVSGIRRLPNERLIVEINQSAEEGFAVLTNKAVGESTIIFRFCPIGFTFGSFMCFPFSLFHECYSHVYTAELFAETLLGKGEVGIFEDGWLLYAAQLAYERKIEQPGSHNAEVAWALRMPHYRRMYLKTRLAELIINPKTHQNTVLGYYAAQWYYEVFCCTDLDLFFRTTHLLYCCPWNQYELEFYNVQHYFVHLVKKLWKRFGSMTRAERDTVKSELQSVVEAENVLELLKLLQHEGT